jgi:predicted dinucleotide-binding enzyme
VSISGREGCFLKRKFEGNIMNVTIIGAGNMGKGLTKQLAHAGHNVTVTARDFSKAQALAQEFANVNAAPAEQALGSSDVIIVATGYADAVPALQSLGDLTGKVVVDISNPLTPDYMGLTLGHSTSAAEEIAKAVPGAQVAKAFNTVFAQILAEGPELQGKRFRSFTRLIANRRARRYGY